MGGDDRSHEVVLEFGDGVTRTLVVSESDTVLGAALEAGVQLVHQCRSGSCGTCSARVVEGRAVMAEDRALGLLPSEIEAGHRLTCSTRIEASTRLRFPYPSDFAFGPMPQRRMIEVSKVRWLTPRVVRLETRLADAARVSFAAGQYMRLEVPGTQEWRSYSMATTQGDLPDIAFLVKVQPAGVMSEYLRRASPGNHLRVEGPYGSFRLRPSRRPHLMVAGGTGLAPMLAMLDELRVEPGRTPPITLCFACSSEDDLFHLDELELRRMWMPTLDLRVSVSRPRASYDGRIGNPVSLLVDDDFACGNSDIYLCGPAGMIDTARRRALSAGVPDDRIFAEQFLPSRNE